MAYLRLAWGYTDLFLGMYRLWLFDLALWTGYTLWGVVFLAVVCLAVLLVYVHILLVKRAVSYWWWILKAYKYSNVYQDGKNMRRLWVCLTQMGYTLAALGNDEFIRGTYSTWGPKRENRRFITPVKVRFVRGADGG